MTITSNICLVFVKYQKKCNKVVNPSTKMQLRANTANRSIQKEALLTIIVITTLLSTPSNSASGLHNDLYWCV